MAVRAGVVTQGPGNCRVKRLGQFMCNVPGLSSTEEQSTGPR